jgi:hypothetical protein
METDMTERPAGFDELLDYLVEHMPDPVPVPQALVRMLPYGKTAELAAKVLAEADTLMAALGTVAHTEDCGGMDRTEVIRVLGIVSSFRHLLAETAAQTADHPAHAPLTGTSGRSLVHTLADSISTMAEPKDGNWREAARKQVERTGSRYVQVWKADATFWNYTQPAPQEQA